MRSIMADDGYKATSLEKSWKGEGQANVVESRLNSKKGWGTAMKPKKGKKSY